MPLASHVLKFLRSDRALAAGGGHNHGFVVFAAAFRVSVDALEIDKVIYKTPYVNLLAFLFDLFHIEHFVRDFQKGKIAERKVAGGG